MHLRPTRRSVLTTLSAAPFGTAVLTTAPPSAAFPATPPPSAAPPTMPPHVLLTDQHRIAARGGVLATHGEREIVWEEIEADGRRAGTVVTVDTADRRHPVEGFGPALTHSSAWLLRRMDARRRRDLLRSLFSPSGPLRLNALRIPLGTCDFAPDEPAPRYFTFADEEGPAADPLAYFSIARDEETILPVLREIVAEAGELTVVMSPWSAPAWMKTSGDLVGGMLREGEGVRDMYARYLARAVAAYEEAVPGLTVRYLTVQNEPLHDTAAYPCMGMSAEVQVEVIERTRDELTRAGLGTQLLAYDHNWDRVDYPLTVLDELAARGIEDVGSCFHAYAGTVDAVAPLHQAHPEAPIWFTEQSGTQDPEKPYEGDFADGIWWMSTQLFLPALRHHHRGVILFNLVLDQDGGPGPATFTNGTGLVQVEESTGELTVNSELYVMGHLSRFVPPGSTVVEATTSEDLPTVAALREDGTVVVVLHNNAESREITVEAGNRRLTAQLPGWTLATYVLTRNRVVTRG